MSGASAFYNHRFLLRVARALASSFVWVTLFLVVARPSGIASGIVAVILGYGLAAAMTFFVAPVVAAEVGHGLRRMMIIGTSVLALGYGFVAALGNRADGDHALYAVLLFAVCYGLYRALYLAPYRVEMHTQPHTPSLGREAVVAFSPLVAGIAASVYGPIAVLFGSAALALASIIPLSSATDVYESFVWSPRETYDALFASRHRHLLYASFARGIESTALFLVWPIIVFFLVGGSYVFLGLVMTLSFLVILIARSSLRRMFGKAHGFVMSLRWVAAGAVAAPSGIIPVTILLHALAHSGSDELLALDHSDDGGTFIDELTVLKEMGGALGKLVLCFVLVILGVFVQTPVALALALLAALVASIVTAAILPRLEVQAY
jgi:hypothetical protein